MGRYYYGWPKYKSVGQKRAEAEKKRAKLLKKDPSLCPVIIEGNKIAHSWWGKAWNANLEQYSDYANRIGRGRSYVRNGAVLDLRIEKGTIRALVQGSVSRPYKVLITIKPVAKKTWGEIRNLCAGKLASLSELLQGNFPKDLSELFTAAGKGLFPAPREIGFECSCPDWASMCKHVAAVLYGIGSRLDSDPSLFFVLRNVEMNDLIVQTLDHESKKLLDKSGEKSGRVIDDADVAGMFGIEMATGNLASDVTKPFSGKRAPGTAAKKVSSGRSTKKRGKTRSREKTKNCSQRSP